MIVKTKLRHIPEKGLRNVMFISDHGIKRNNELDGINKIPGSKRLSIYNDYDIVKRLAKNLKVNNFKEITINHLAENNHFDKRLMNNIFLRYYNPQLIKDLIGIKIGEFKPEGISNSYIKKVQNSLKNYSDSMYIKKYSTSSNCISLVKTINERNTDPVRTAKAIRQILIDINEGRFTYDTLSKALDNKNKHISSLYDKIMDNMYFYLNIKKYIKDFNMYGYFIHDGIRYKNASDLDIPIYCPLIGLLKPNKSGYILNEELELVKADKE